VEARQATPEIRAAMRCGADVHAWHSAYGCGSPCMVPYAYGCGISKERRCPPLALCTASTLFLSQLLPLKSLWWHAPSHSLWWRAQLGDTLLEVQTDLHRAGTHARARARAGRAALSQACACMHTFVCARAEAATAQATNLEMLLDQRDQELQRLRLALEEKEEELAG